jgi:hypothetical protein
MMKQEITDKMRHEMPFYVSRQIIPCIHEAMDIYAKSEAIAFANWLSHTEYNRKTINELWKEYQNIFEEVHLDDGEN